MLTNGTSSIVIVDDERIVLKSIKAILSLKTDHDISTFTNPIEALEHIKTHEVDLIMSDYLMPEMDGIALLSKIREVKPLTTRILLTGYADKENAIKGINEAGLFNYMEKPWDNNDLLMIIRNGLDKMNLLRRLELKIIEYDETHTDLKKIHAEILKAFA